MDERVRQVLRALVTEHGAEMATDAARCESLLRGRCPANKREVALLLGVLRSGVMGELQRSAAGAATVGRVGMLAHRIEDELGVTADAARWAVESWALALGWPLEVAKPVAQATPAAPVRAPVPVFEPRPAIAPAPPPVMPAFASAPAPVPGAVAASEPAPLPELRSTPVGAPRRGNRAWIAAAAMLVAAVLYVFWRVLRR